MPYRFFYIHYFPTKEKKKIIKQVLLAALNGVNEKQMLSLWIKASVSWRRGGGGVTEGP